MSVLCVGQLVADVVVRPVDSLPIPGRTDAVDELMLVAGGCAANTASVLTKLGLDASVAGLVGNDRLGDAVISELVSCGVDVTPTVRDSSTPTSAVIVVVHESGERSFLYREGGNERLSAQSISDSVMRKADFMHVGGAMKLASLDLAALLTRAKAAGCTTSLDTDWDANGRWMDMLLPALGHVDYLLTNEEEGRMLTGIKDPWDIGRSLLSKGPGTVVIKCGSLGAIVCTDNLEEEFPTFDVPVFDTTCAGDAFAAGLLFGLSRTWELGKAATFANAVAALCTTRLSHSAVTSITPVLDLLGDGFDATPRQKHQVRAPSC